MLPAAINSALSVALYGMFLAVVIPAAKKTRPVLLMVLLAAAISCILYYVPLFQGISAGMSIIICTVAASVVGAIVFPVKEEGGAK